MKAKCTNGSVVSLTLVIVMIIFTGTAYAQQTNKGALKFAADQTINHEINAVPAPGPVKIDGQLDEWDQSGGILCCKDVDTMLDEYATWFYMMYDRDAFYVAAKVTDKTPMVNVFNPNSEQLICHRGDTVFFRSQFEQKYTNFFVYYWSEQNRPAVVLAAGRQWNEQQQYSDGISAGCNVAFQKFALYTLLDIY